MTKGAKTKMVKLNAMSTEICREEGLGLNDTHPADPPWFVVRYRGKYWGLDRWNYIWLVYAGPPQIFLTRKMAEEEAKSFREQYGGGSHHGGGPLKVEVVCIAPCPR